MNSAKIEGGSKIFGLLLVLICVATLNACGKKGPLYIPIEPESAAVTNEPVEPKKSEKTEAQAITSEVLTDEKKTTKKPADQ